MLIIATPKSASSSLAETISRATGLPVENRTVRQLLKDARAAEGFPLMSAIHNEGFELDRGNLDVLLALPGIKKHHILPTPNNVLLLKDVRKVILLRPPDEVVDAYWRGFDTGVWTHAHTVMAGARSLEEWRAAAREAGLLDELHRFNEGWRTASGSSVIIDYASLIADSEGTVKKVLSFFDIAVETVPELAREKFTREQPSGSLGALRRTWRKVHARLRTAYRSASGRTGLPDA